ncbi:MAG: FtsX-like permease family protein, partial [Desulfobacteraceae bacterium]|nr:FtsX-like permease family protein [Desulfobacteraceae bacterium]
KKIDPLIMVASDNYYGMKRPYISIRLFSGDHQKTMKKVKKLVSQFFPETPFKYDYVDNEIEKMHWERNDPWKNVLVFSTTICVFLACLGLFGFAEYEIGRKTKEIGIRKAVGATYFQIAGLFIKRFMLMAIIANGIAWVISYLVIGFALDEINYPYAIDLKLSVFIGVTILTLFLTVLTVSVQTLKAASMDPQNALRDE